MWSTKYLSEGQVDLSRPFVWTLPQARRTLLFVDLSPSDDASMTKAFSLVSDAARRADNFGTDEMPTVEYLRWILATFADDVMAVYDVATSGKDSCSDSLMVGLLAVVPCRYVRSCHPINCSLIMVTAESISTHLVWRDLARLGCEIGRRGEKRYRGCTVDVFITCVELVAALREEGFFIVSYVPDAGLVSGFPGRHIASYVMYKELGIPSVGAESRAELVGLLSDDDVARL